MILEGNLVYLREVQEKDILEIQKIANDEEVSKYVPFLPYPFTKKIAKKYFSGIKENNGEFGVFLKSTNEVIGIFTLYKINKLFRSAELGYWLGKDYWGKGYSDDALNVLLKYVFEELNSHRVMAKVSSLNIRSINFLSRNGFRKEGTLREAEIYDGQYVDLEIFGLLKEECTNF
jgi:[ribosomal protein S5]-alanine N-acetyltransferase